MSRYEAPKRPALALQVSMELVSTLHPLKPSRELLEELQSPFEERRLLAVMTANLTCDLLEQDELSKEEKLFLIMIAEKSRRLWLQDGSPSDQERAIFRLTQSYQRCQQPSAYGSGRYPRFQWIKA